ncbi:MAG TPA: monovalent cation/H+ antiporter complex subunit F [Stellaceae bacterium]|nr:monovalent cation/H+ antiporter complex subunit F [Stellaceae bacterium]
MNVWLVCTIALFPPLAVVFYVGFRGDLADRLVAVVFASSMTTLVLVLMSFAFDQPSLVDLPLAITFVSLPGLLVFAHVIERWL